LLKDLAAKGKPMDVLGDQGDWDSGNEKEKNAQHTN
jgi:hypothetical protein